MTWEAPWIQRKRLQPRSKEDSDYFLSFSSSIPLTQELPGCETGLEVKTAQLWDFPVLFAIWSLRNMGFCFLLEMHAEKHDGNWHSCYIFVDGCCSLCTAQQPSPSPPHSPSLQEFQVLHSLSAARPTKDIFHEEKHSLSFFTFYLRWFRCFNKKNFSCVVRVSLSVGMLPVKPPWSVAASPAPSLCCLPIWKQVFHFQVYSLC